MSTFNYKYLAAPAVLLLLIAAGCSGRWSGIKSHDAVRVVLQADPGLGDDWPADAQGRAGIMRSAAQVLSNRLRALCGVEAVIDVVGEDKLEVELPGVDDPAEAFRLLTTTARLQFYYMKDLQSEMNPIADWRVRVPAKSGDPYIFTGPDNREIDSIKQHEELLKEVVGVPKVKPLMTGDDLIPNAKANINPSMENVINLTFNPQGATKFADFTRDHVREYLAVFYDGRLLTCPVVMEPILDGKAEISGFRTLLEAREVADLLNAGALPIPLRILTKHKP